MSKNFQMSVNWQLDRVQDILKIKGSEYSTENDRLHNFRVAAQLQGVPMRQALAGMMAKHTTSIYDMCRQSDLAPEAIWEEKITDHIIYLLLLRYMVKEEMYIRTNSTLKEDQK